MKTKSRAGKACTIKSPSKSVGTGDGSAFVPMELAPTPDIDDPNVSELQRVTISGKDGKERPGISFMVDMEVPARLRRGKRDLIVGTEILLDTGQLQKLLDFARWKRVPRKLSPPNIGHQPRSPERTPTL